MPDRKTGPESSDGQKAGRHRPLGPLAPGQLRLGFRARTDNVGEVWQRGRRRSPQAEARPKPGSSSLGAQREQCHLETLGGDTVAWLSTA